MIHELKKRGMDEDLPTRQVEKKAARLAELRHHPQDLRAGEFRDPGRRLVRKVAIEVVAVQALDVAAERDLEARVQRNAVGIGPFLDRLQETVAVLAPRDGMIRAADKARGIDHEIRVMRGNWVYKTRKKRKAGGHSEDEERSPVVPLPGEEAGPRAPRARFDSDFEFQGI